MIGMTMSIMASGRSSSASGTSDGQLVCAFICSRLQPSLGFGRTLEDEIAKQETGDGESMILGGRRALLRRVVVDPQQANVALKILSATRRAGRNVACAGCRLTRKVLRGWRPDQPCLPV